MIKFFYYSLLIIVLWALINMMICLREMLMDTLREMINNIFKESFYGKKKLMFWQIFSFPIKVVTKLS